MDIRLTGSLEHVNSASLMHSCTTSWTASACGWCTLAQNLFMWVEGLDRRLWVVLN